MKSDAQREWEVREFDRLYERMRSALAGFGDDDGTLARGSYWIHEDYWVSGRSRSTSPTGR